MVSAGMKCVKYMLVFFNFFIALAGLALIVAGALVQTKYNEYLSFFGGTTNAAAIFLLVVGIIVFVIGFFGCCGALKENHCMVVTFVILLCIVLVLEIAAAITAFMLRNQIMDIVGGKMKSATKNYGDPSHEGVTKAWNTVQKTFLCCGAINYTDWMNNPHLSQNKSVPDSCCQTFKPQCGYNVFGNSSPRPEVIYQDGCISQLDIWVKGNIVIVGAMAAGLTIIEIIGIIIAGCLAKAIRREYEVV